MISDQIKFYRKSLGFTQQEVAERLNISRQGYLYYEKGTREPNVETIKKLCLIFDCTADELLEIETPAQRKKVTINHSFNNSRNINVKL